MIHYTPQHVWDNYRITILCGAEFTDGVTNSKEAVTCPVCLEMIRKEREQENIKVLGFGQYQTSE